LGSIDPETPPTSLPPSPVTPFEVKRDVLPEANPLLEMMKQILAEIDTLKERQSAAGKAMEEVKEQQTAMAREASVAEERIKEYIHSHRVAAPPIIQTAHVAPSPAPAFVSTSEPNSQAYPAPPAAPPPPPAPPCPPVKKPDPNQGARAAMCGMIGELQGVLKDRRRERKEMSPAQAVAAAAEFDKLVKDRADEWRSKAEHSGNAPQAPWATNKGMGKVRAIVEDSTPSESSGSGQSLKVDNEPPKAEELKQHLVKPPRAQVQSELADTTVELQRAVHKRGCHQEVNAAKAVLAPTTAKTKRLEATAQQREDDDDNELKRVFERIRRVAPVVVLSSTPKK
jgi:hypothetical protein